MDSRSISAQVGFCVLLLLTSLLAACGSGAGSTITQPPPPAEFLFAAGQNSEIATQEIELNDGTLTNLTFTPGTIASGSLAVSPAGSFLYSGSPTMVGVNGFSVSPAGVLSTLSSSPFPIPSASGIQGVAIDPGGKFLYATGTTAPGNGLVAGFSIDSTTGALSPIAGSPFAAGTGAVQLVVDPSGRFLYVSDSSGILAFSISSTTGVLSPISGSPFPGGPQALQVAPGGKYLYAIDFSNVVWAYSIDSSTGSLAQVTGSPFLDPTGVGNPTGPLTGALSIAPSGGFLYTYNTLGADSTISGFAIDNRTGTLSPVPGSPFATGETALFFANMTIEPSGKFLCASCWDANCGILAFSIDATSGALTPVMGSPFNSAASLGSLAAIRVQ
jgi:6-phosphogluconolactonase